MEQLNVGLIGTGFMGRTHSNAYAQVGKFFQHSIRPVMKAVCARDAERTGAFARNWGWEEVDSDWRALVARDDIDVVDICTPNNTHLEIALAAAAAGKIIVCEKPLAMDAQEALQMVEAAEAGGRPTMVSFNYRRIPAVMLAKQLVDAGPARPHLPLPGQVFAGLDDQPRPAAGRAIRCGGWMRRRQAVA